MVEQARSINKEISGDSTAEWCAFFVRTDLFLYQFIRTTVVTVLDPANSTAIPTDSAITFTLEFK